jgi:hypothetical protein
MLAVISAQSFVPPLCTFFEVEEDRAGDGDDKGGDIEDEK